MEILIVLIVLSAIAIILLSLRLTSSIKKFKGIEESYNNLQKDVKELEENNRSLTQRNQDLAHYEAIMATEEKAKQHLEEAKEQVKTYIKDAEIQSANIFSEASKQAEEIKLEADRILADAKSEKERILDDANNDRFEIKRNALDEAEKIKRNASLLLSKAEYEIKTAEQEKDRIISKANEKAKEIAAEAYEIAMNAKKYEEIEKAMRNIIKGYGDEYLKPSYTLLDELADDFGFDEAGQKLKEARERTKKLAKYRRAAACDYVEENRRTTAINFVTDAFNGKIDSILSTIKKNNIGILERKIIDAFILVNNLGAAFRNARITEEYLEARLEELKYGAIVNELKLQEREEQRRINEQIREEERARREYERAIKEAAKEEEMIRKAMEKAQQAIEKATEEQKSKYEEQLLVLQDKLKEAEEKNQRALSMAQQTKSGHVYIISNIGSFGENIYKIGMTRRLEPLERVRELGDASVPFPFDVHAMIYSENAPELETELHKYFVQNQVNKVNPRKEFFRVPISEIKEEVVKRGLQVKWTITAEATEYRETLAIEKAMANNQLIKEEWIDKQGAIIHTYENEED